MKFKESRGHLFEKIWPLKTEENERPSFAFYATLAFPSSSIINKETESKEKKETIRSKSNQ